VEKQKFFLKQNNLKDLVNFLKKLDNKEKILFLVQVQIH
jgi:hypothetical protein